MLAQDGGDTTISFYALDISKSDSIKSFRDFLKSEHPDGIDAVINNAGIMFDGMSSTESTG